MNHVVWRTVKNFPSASRLLLSRISDFVTRIRYSDRVSLGVVISGMDIGDVGIIGCVRIGGMAIGVMGIDDVGVGRTGIDGMRGAGEGEGALGAALIFSNISG